MYCPQPACSDCRYRVLTAWQHKITWPSSEHSSQRNNNDERAGCFQENAAQSLLVRCIMRSSQNEKRAKHNYRHDFSLLVRLRTLYWSFCKFHQSCADLPRSFHTPPPHPKSPRLWAVNCTSSELFGVALEELILFLSFFQSFRHSLGVLSGEGGKT